MRKSSTQLCKRAYVNHQLNLEFCHRRIFNILPNQVARKPFLQGFTFPHLALD